MAVLLCATAWPSAAAAAPTARFAGPASTLATGNCTDQANPCTLPYALSKSTDGDDLTVLPGSYVLTAQLATAAEVNIHGLAGAPRPLIKAVPGFAFPIEFQSGGGSLRHLAFQSSPGDGFVLDLVVPVVEDISVTASGVTNAGVLLRQGTAVTTLRDSTVSVTTTSAGVAAVEARGADVRNVTAYAHGPGSTGVLAHALGGSAITVNATNVIAHGDGHDIAAVNDAAAPGAVLNVDHSAFSGTPTSTGLGNTVHVTNQVTALPVLKDAPNGDFHELAGSPTIDAGVTDPANGTADPDGTPRPFGGGTDIGAYEFIPPPTVSTLAATEVTQTSATLAASVNPNGTATPVQFVIDSGPGAPRTITAGSLPADSAAHSVSVGVAGLTAGSTYTYHAHASNTGGSADGLEQTFTTRAVPAPHRPAPPVLSRVGITMRRFTVSSSPTALIAVPAVGGRRTPGGTAFTYNVNERATVKIVIDRSESGRRAGKRCVAPRRGLQRAKRCTRAIRQGLFTRASLPGFHRIPFSGRIGRRALPPSGYTAVVTAYDGIGQSSRSFRIPFTIVRNR